MIIVPRMAGRALVTGGAGFIGSHVIDAFLDRGYEAAAVDDLSSGEAENVPNGAALEVVDIRDADALARIGRDFRPTVVCHLAAQASVTYSVEEPVEDLEINVRGTLNVLETARAAGARTLFASTGGALYGEGVPMPTPEETPALPLSPYGASKLAGEAYVRTWSILHDLPNVVLRLANVYGPRQKAHTEAGVVAIFSDKLLNARQPTVFGDGEQTRDYVHVNDVARAFVLAAESGSAETYNVGTGIETTVNQLLARLQQVAGTQLEPRFEPLRPGELKRSALDASRLTRALGWRPERELADGLAETFGFYAARTAKSAGAP